MSIIENFISSISPKTAYKREVYRQKCRMIREISNSGYDEGGASHRKNSTKGWIARSESPQHDIDRNLNTLRQRSRNLYMTSPLATSALKSSRTNCVGSGLILKPIIDFKYLGLEQDEASKLKQQIVREWKVWCESKFCDNARQNNFYELQQIAFLSWLMNGDALGIIRYDEEFDFQPYQLRIKLIEADKLSSPGSISEEYFHDTIERSTENRIVNGIEIDKNGAVVAYHICNSYFSDELVNREWVRIEAFGKRTGNPNIIHVFDAERCEQYRGVPFLAPVIETLKQLTRYQEAEIMAAVINSMFSVFIKTEDGDDNVDFEGLDEEYETKDTDYENDSDYKIGPGVINYLKEGESIEIADAKRPGNNFDAFVSSMCKYIGAALEIPYEILMKSFTASYSASRGALLEAWKAFKTRRTWFANDFCKPIYEIWLSEAVAKGRVNCPGFFTDPSIRRAYSGSDWIGPAPGQLDPVKEAQGAELRIKNGFSTRETEAAEINGSSFENNVEQLKIENAKLNEAKVKEE